MRQFLFLASLTIISYVAGFRAVFTKSFSVRSSSSLLMSDDYFGFDSFDEKMHNDKFDIETGLTFRKNKLKPKDKRDMLPFEVYDDKDQKTLLGSYLLDSTTACGDFVDLGMKGVFSVKRVVFVYKFQQGYLRVVKKKLHLVPQPDRQSVYWANQGDVGGVLQ